MAEALRQVDSLGRPETDALANLLEAGANDHGPWPLLYPRKLVFRPRGRLAARKSLTKKNRPGQFNEPQVEISRQIELTPDGNLQGVESSPEQRFREALSEADASAAAAALRDNSLDRRAVDALIYLFDVTTKHSGSWEDLRRHKLVFRRKRRGAPKDREKLWVRDPQVAAFVERNTDKLRKIAVSDASKEFGLSRSSIFSAMARKGSPNDERDEELANSLD